MRKIKFASPVPETTPRTVPDHWTEIAPKEARSLNMLPIVPGINGQHAYMVTSDHWADLLTSLPENQIQMPWGPHAVLAYGTSHEAALAAFHLLQGES